MKHILLLLVIFISRLYLYGQNSQADLFFNVVIDTAFSKQAKDTLYPNVILTRKEKQKLLLNLNTSLKDTSNFRESFLDKGISVIDLKNTTRLTKVNDGYLTPYFGNTNGHIPPIQNDSILYYSVVQKFSDEGEPLYDLETGHEIHLEVINKRPLIDNIKSIQTTESWNYNKKVFSKKIKTISLSRLDFDEQGEYKATRQLFTKLNSKKEKKGKLIKENISYDFLFNPYHNKQHENLDLFEEEILNKVISYDLNDLADFEKNTLLLALLKDIYNKKLPVYQLNGEKMNLNSFEAVFIEKYSYQEIDETGEPLYDIEGNAIMKTTYEPIRLDDIIGFHFTEDWYTAKKDFNIIKEVKSLSFLIYDYDEDGTFIGIKKLPCIVKFKN